MAALSSQARSGSVRALHWRAATTVLAALSIAFYLGFPASPDPSPSRQQKAADNPGSWQSLQPQQREALMPLGRDWASLDASTRKRWLETAALLSGKTATERGRAAERLGAWAAMSPATRTVARVHFASVRQISPERRRRDWARYMERSQHEATKRKSTEAFVPVAPGVVRVAPGATTILLDRIAPRPSGEHR